MTGFWLLTFTMAFLMLPYYLGDANGRRLLSGRPHQQLSAIPLTLALIGVGVSTLVWIWAFFVFSWWHPIVAAVLAAILAPVFGAIFGGSRFTAALMIIGWNVGACLAIATYLHVSKQ